MSRVRSASAVVAALASTAVVAALADGRPLPTHEPTCGDAWRLSIAEGPGEPPLRALQSLDANGSLVYSETSAITSLTPGVATEFTSPGVGTWRPTASGCRYRILVNAADVSGRYVRTSDISGTVTLSRGGGRLAGSVRIDVTHADGSRFRIRTTVTGSRIGV